MKKRFFLILLSTFFITVIFSNENLKQKFKETMQKAEQGDTEAQWELGLMYDKGLGVKKDYEKAFKLYNKALKRYKKSIDSGSLIAEFEFLEKQNFLGIMYYDGKEVTQDFDKAFYWFKQVAEQKYAESQFYLGLMYKKGQGVTQDYKKAYEWFQKAAEQGNISAQYHLKLNYSRDEYNYSTLENTIKSYTNYSAKISFTPKSKEFEFLVIFKISFYKNNRIYNIKINELKRFLLSNPRYDPYREQYPEFYIKEDYGSSGNIPKNFNTDNFKKYALETFKELLVTNKIPVSSAYKTKYDENQVFKYIEEDKMEQIRADIEWDRAHPSETESLIQTVENLKEDIENLKDSQNLVNFPCDHNKNSFENLDYFERKALRKAIFKD